MIYFGCKNEAGHYCWDETGKRLFRHENLFLLNHDTKLAPQNDKTESRAILHHYPDFTVLAYWDYKVDSRPGSNSMFLTNGKKSPQEIIDEIKTSFPDIWERSPATIIEEITH